MSTCKGSKSDPMCHVGCEIGLDMSLTLCPCSKQRENAKTINGFNPSAKPRQFAAKKILMRTSLKWSA